MGTTADCRGMVLFQRGLFVPQKRRGMVFVSLGRPVGTTGGEE